MSMISKQVKKIRKVAKCVYLAADKEVADDIANTLNQAADTIEALSAKLQAAKMDRSSAYYGEELKEAKETIRKLLCSEYGSSCQFCIQDKNENAMCRKVGGSGSWCCENAKWNGKSK